MTHALIDRADTMHGHPYGDVKYADPGYQADGTARYPLDTAEHCRSAWSYINMPRNASAYTPSQLKDIKDRIVSAGKKFGIEFDYDSETNEPAGPEEPEHNANRSQAGAPQEWGYSLLRSYALEDIEIDRSSGREVTAYAAMFDQPYEVRDQHGHYMEQIERSAFNRTIANGNALRSAVCLYNHGYSLAGAPMADLQVPLGTPLEIRAESKGLLTRTRYNKTPMADAVLESIRNGDITSQSFRGRIIRSTPDRIPRVRDGQALPMVVRNELGLSDYGPTPIAVNSADMEFAVRSRLLAELDRLDPQERAEVLRKYNPTPHGDPGLYATPDSGLGAEDPPIEALRSASTQAAIARRIAAFRILENIR